MFSWLRRLKVLSLTLGKDQASPYVVCRVSNVTFPMGALIFDVSLVCFVTLADILLANGLESLHWTLWFLYMRLANCE